MYVCGSVEEWCVCVWGVRVGGGMVCTCVDCGGMVWRRNGVCMCACVGVWSVCDKYPCRCLGTTVAVL